MENGGKASLKIGTDGDSSVNITASTDHPLTTPYRPSNGTEGEGFQMKFCDKCEHEREWRKSERNPCNILGLTMAFDIADPEYPKEWIEDATGARCTAFLAEGSPTQDRIDSDRARYEAALAEMRAVATPTHAGKGLSA